MTRTYLSSGLVLLVLSGCASLDPGPDIEQAAQTVTARTGVPVHWQADANERQALTRELLAQPLSAQSAVQIALSGRSTRPSPRTTRRRNWRTGCIRRAI